MQDSPLDDAISAIRVRFGSQALTRAAELPPPQPWLSGTPLDRLTGIGGLPRGRLTLLTGSGTCGKHTLALALLAGATHEFAHTVVIDNRSGQGDSAGRDPARRDGLPGRRDKGGSPFSFDPWPMLAFDPDLRALTVVRLQSDNAGEAATALAKAGAGFLLLMGEIPEPWLGPLEAGANRSGTVLVGVVDAPGRAFAHASSLSLGFSRTEWIIERGLLVGLRTIARCLKNRVAPPLGESELEIRYPQGAELFLQNRVTETQLQPAELECTSAVV
jgi:recombination protein RecA